MTSGPRAGEERDYDVLYDGQRVLTFRARPGALVSTARRAPGRAAPSHPFLDARALDAGHEDQLASIVHGAEDLSQLLAALERHGYEVREDDEASDRDGGST